MKKIMILGSSILQLPAIIKAKEMGFQVVAVDMNPEAIGFKYADFSEIISTNDIENVLIASKKHMIDGIMTLASDRPMNTVAAIASELKLVGISEETALKATNKGVMRDCLAENRIPIPIFYRVNEKKEYLNAINKLNARCIVKPADNSGSRGIYLLENINDSRDVDYAFSYSKQHSKSGEIVVEEFMEGPEVSVEIICIDGACQIIQITDKLTTGSPHFIEMGHSEPTMHLKEVEKQIEKVANAAVKAIGLKNGPAHVEVKITEQGPKIVELGARLGGDNITTHLVPLSTGIDMIECSIKIALGEVPDLAQKIKKGSTIRYFKTSPGIITTIQGVEEAKKLPGVKEINFVKSIGDRVGTIESSNDRVGYVIAQGENANQSIKFCEEAIRKIKIELEDDK